MLVKEVIHIIEDFAPLSYQENYDNAGLIVGNPENEVTGILIAIDCIEEIIDEAIELNYNMIITHHPIVFRGLKTFTGKNYIERVVIKAIKNNIVIYAAHTNLDNAKDGVSFKMAKEIGLTNCTVLHPKNDFLYKLVVYAPSNEAGKVRDAMFDAGAGKIGNYAECSFNSEGKGSFLATENAHPFVGKKGQRHYEEEIKIETIVPTDKLQTVISTMIAAHPYEEVAYDIFALENTIQTVGGGVVGILKKPEKEKDFLLRLKKELNLGCIKHTHFLNKKIKRVAICGGAGSFLLKQAMNAKADIFITGDFKYHQFFDAENKIIIADIGHYESEQYTNELIYEILIKKIPNFAIHLTKKNTNPINYL